MMEMNIQSNVSVICVVMELAEDVRKGSESPLFPVETTAFSSPCTALGSLRRWGCLESLPTPLLIAVPPCVGVLFTRKHLRQDFSFEGEMVSLWPNEWLCAESSSPRAETSSGATVKTPVIEETWEQLLAPYSGSAETQTSFFRLLVSQSKACPAASNSCIKTKEEVSFKNSQLALSFL